jgi:hypothetical protein
MWMYGWVSLEKGTTDLPSLLVSGSEISDRCLGPNADALLVVVAAPLCD